MPPASAATLRQLVALVAAHELDLKNHFLGLYKRRHVAAHKRELPQHPEARSEGAPSPAARHWPRSRCEIKVPPALTFHRTIHLRGLHVPDVDHAAASARSHRAQCVLPLCNSNIVYDAVLLRSIKRWLTPSLPRDLLSPPAPPPCAVCPHPLLSFLLWSSRHSKSTRRRARTS